VEQVRPRLAIVDSDADPPGVGDPGQPPMAPPVDDAVCAATGWWPSRQQSA